MLGLSKGVPTRRSGRTRRMSRIWSILGLGLLARAVSAATAAAGQETAVNGDALTVEIRSTKDGTGQHALLDLPPEGEAKAAGAPVPLLVVLHTWSSTYRQETKAIPLAHARGWITVVPDFRGPNKTPAACASEAAIQDVLDAVAFARQKGRVDAARIYLLGASGGGHMALMMAAKSPKVWAGVSAWVPISDLAVWYDQTKQAKRAYWQDLEKVCGGPPGPATLEAYRARSPLFYLAAARGLPLDLNTGIHDGHTGSVPVSQSLRAFNVLAVANGCQSLQLADAEIDALCQTQQIPPALGGARVEDLERQRAVLWRRVAGPVRISIFEGGHDVEVGAALAWLARQKQGASADFSIGAAKPADGSKKATGVAP